MRVIGTIMLLSVFVNIAVYHENIIPTIPVAIMGTAFFFMPKILQQYSLRVYRNNETFRSNVSVEADEQLFTENSINANVQLRWKNFENWIETNDFFAIVQVTSHNSHWYPKRAFAYGEEERFRQLLMKVIPTKK